MVLPPKLLGLVAMGVVIAAGAAAAQEEKATGVVAVRQAVMKAQGAHVAAVKTILTEYPQLLVQVPAHAKAVADMAQHTPEMFPAGSEASASRALPPVWTDTAGFAAASKRAEELALKLAAAAESGDAQATLAAFAALGKDGCGSCHETYRRPQD